MPSASKIGIVILAAGLSSRLGKPKQMLEFKGKSLLKHAVTAAVDSNASFVVVVIGANATLIVKELDNNEVHVVENKNWQEGMASSIRCGLKAVTKKAPLTDAVIFLVCDQPHISAKLVNEIIMVHQQTGRPIVACNYGDTFGPPVLFYKSFFDELNLLQGDVGAKKIIQQYSEELTSVPFAAGTIDIDKEQDYEALKKWSSKTI